jgi:hypothetical protein
MALPPGFELENASSLPQGFELETGQPQGNYMVEALRKGPASSVGLVSGIANALSEAASRTGFNPLDLGIRAGEATRRALGLSTPAPAPAPPQQTYGEAFLRGREPVYQGLMGALGSTGAQPSTTGERIVAGGLQAATSPESYLFPPLAAVRRMGVLGQAVARPAEQAIVGSGGEAGGIAGEYAGQKVGAETAGRVLGGIVGGGGTAYALGGSPRLASLTGKGVEVARNQWNKIRGTVPEDEFMRDVDSRISNVFIAAAQADPNFMRTLETASKAQQSVSLKAPGAPQVNMPMSALLANNPVIDSFIQNLSARDPVFREQFAAQFEAAKSAMTQNQIRLFGDPSKAVVTAAAPDLAKVQARRVRTLDQQIADAYQGQSVDPNAFGQRVANLIEQKETAARASTRPLYQEAFDIAKAKNVELPAASVDDIYNFVAGERASDVFKKNFPSIYGQILQRFRPATTEPSAILTAQGTPMTPGGQQYSAATVQDLDSLKREINRLLRSSQDENNIRLLNDLKTRVGGHINSLDPDFVTAYRNADNAYFQRVGLPFDTATLRSVDRKKFVEQIAPAIIGNKSNVSDLITATGEEGVNLARSAFLDSFTTAAVKNDVLDPKAAAKWLKKNEGGVSLIPGLREELDGATRNVQQLLDARSRLNADFQRVAGEQVLSTQGVRSPQELVSKMYGDVKFTNRFMQQYGADKDSVNAVRAFMLDDIVSSGDPLAMLADRNKAAIFNRVFGPTYAQKVQDFATVASRLSRDVTDVGFRGETVPKTPIEQLTGIPPEQIISRIYNPVSGATYAVTSLFSKFWANKASQATEEKLKNLLLNPTDAVRVFQAVQPNTGAINPENLRTLVDIGRRYGIDWARDAAADITTGAARGGVQQMQGEQ